MRLVVGWPPCAVASPLVVVVCSLVRLLVLGAWLPAASLVPPLPPAAGETPALALSPVGMLWPVRLWGSSPSVAGMLMGLPPSAADAAMTAEVPPLLGEVTKAGIGVSITLVQLCCRLLPLAATAGWGPTVPRWLARLRLLPVASIPPAPLAMWLMLAGVCSARLALRWAWRLPRPPVPKWQA